MTLSLPLVPFEQYMLAEHNPRYPRVFYLDIVLSGNLDRAALERAWPIALARHPLLTALLAKTRRGWQWTTGDAAPRPIDWGGQDEPIDLTDGQFVDLTRQSGVRLWARCGTAAARLLFELHHSCCDGLGGFRFVGDVLAAYARQTSGDSAAKLPPLDAELLEGRGTFGITRPTPREWIGHAAYTLTDGLRLMARRPLAVAVPQTNSDTTVHSPPVHRIETRILDPAELDALQRTARASGVTVNDLLLCYLFAALLDWNRVHGRREPRGWLRVNVPTNLRRREDERMPAANVMSFAFLDRHTRDCQDLAGLLQSIRRETKAIKDRRLGLYFIVQMGILAAIPGAMPFALSRGRCLATAVLTNVGDLTGPWSEQLPRQGDKLAVGNLVLESVGGTPPLRRLTHVGVGVATYGGRMSVSLLCDRHCFNQEQAGQFLDSYVARILAGVE